MGICGPYPGQPASPPQCSAGRGHRPAPSLRSPGPHAPASRALLKLRCPRATDPGEWAALGGAQAWRRGRLEQALGLGPLQSPPCSEMWSFRTLLGRPWPGRWRLQGMEQTVMASPLPAPWHRPLPPPPRASDFPTTPLLPLPRPCPGPAKPLFTQSGNPPIRHTPAVLVSKWLVLTSEPFHILFPDCADFPSCLPPSFLFISNSLCLLESLPKLPSHQGRSASSSGGGLSQVVLTLAGCHPHAPHPASRCHTYLAGSHTQRGSHTPPQVRGCVWPGWVPGLPRAWLSGFSSDLQPRSPTGLLTWGIPPAPLRPTLRPQHSLRCGCGSCKARERRPGRSDSRGRGGGARRERETF